MLLLRRALPRRARLRGRAWPLPAAIEIRHDLRGPDDGARFVVSVQLQRMPRMVPRQAQPRARAPVPTGGATRLRQLRARRRAHCHSISAARARGRCLLPWGNRPRSSCGASNARSSICAYSLLLAHQRTFEQSSHVAARVPGVRHRVIGPWGHRVIEGQRLLNLDDPITRWPDHPMKSCLQ